MIFAFLRLEISAIEVCLVNALKTKIYWCNLC